MRSHWSRPRAGAGIDPGWTPELAALSAKNAGIDRLTDHHWKVITSCREDAARWGRLPGRQRIETLTGLGPEMLAKLFPGDVETLIARIAGLAPPQPGHANPSHTDARRNPT